MLKKFILIAATAGSLTAGTSALTSPAEANPYWHPWRHHYHMRHCRIHRVWRHHHWVVRQVCFRNW